ncbi:MAG: UDP-N-acetylmuramate dehydrogenase [Neptuniibacter sp.]
MINWQENSDLSKMNSLGFRVTAERFTNVETVEHLQAALKDVEDNNWPLLILGGGSNLVLRSFIPGAVISVALKGINVLADNETDAIVEVGAGENWHDFIGQLLQMGLHGLENLALIPGNVGAAPVQNIGAYGVELADCFHSLTAYDCEAQEIVQLDRSSCRFGYRDSLFKSVAPGRYIIWQVRFLLSSVFSPNLSYKGLSQYLNHLGIDSPNAHDVYKAVCEIRKNKLPTPAELGNAGSFFENPVVSATKYEQLKHKHPDLVAYDIGCDQYKLAAGWLLDRAGWKGYSTGSVGVYEKQALVLVNHGEGNAEQLLQLADEIKQSVTSTFDVQLRMEPRIYPPL